MVIIDNRQRIFGDTFIVPKDGTLRFTASIGDAPMAIELGFAEDIDGSTPARITWKGDPTSLILTLVNWSKLTNGSVSIDPFKWGSTGEDKLYMAAVGTLVATIWSIRIEIYTGK